MFLKSELLKLPASQPSVAVGSVITPADGPLAITDRTGKPAPSSSSAPQSTLPVGSSSSRDDNTTRSLLPCLLVAEVIVSSSSARAVKVFPRQPFLFSGDEAKRVKCWDLEYNKVIRHYHGDLSSVRTLFIHPRLELLISCVRDSTARVWDMRIKALVHCLSGHTNTVSDVVTQAPEPQNDMDERKTLYGSIILSGGSTLFQGFGDRLLSEMRRLSPQDTKVRITAPQERLYSTSMGGSILASLDTFRKLWVSKKEYEDEGKKILHRKFF